MMPTMEDFKKAALDAIGVGVGYLASDFAGEYVARASNQTGWTKTGIKAAVRLVFGVLGIFAGNMTSGALSVFLFMFAVGALAGILVDILEAVVPGGVPSLTTSMVSRMNEGEDIIVRSERPEEIKALVRW